MHRDRRDEERNKMEEAGGKDVIVKGRREEIKRGQRNKEGVN